jgi:hypothetical protein
MNKIEKAAKEYVGEIEDIVDMAGYNGFIKGAKWHEEQSATDAIEFVEWVTQWPYRYLLGKSYKELYELWNQTKVN